MKYFCTSFDRNFLVRGLTLYDSLQVHAGAFQLWVLCFDDFTFETLKKMASPGLIPISMRDFEAANPDLKAVEASRSRVEYYFTCTPSLPLYVLEQNPAIDVISYLDADLFFFSSPRALFEELGEASILIIEHRFPEAHRHQEEYGKFNVGLLSFRNDDVGLECLRSWRAQCIEWCYDRLESARYADQKYLDAWPGRFKSLVISKLKGANLAPWNVFGYDLSVSNGKVLVDGQDLIFYHFHQMKMVNSWICDPGLWRHGGGKYFSTIRDRIYMPYLAALDRVRKATDAPPGKQGTRYGNRSVLGSVARSLVRGQLLVAPRGFGNC